ncbi:hypothetical protein [Rhodopirellula sallentina]|uniref:Uncharacterized protein n=1 Tax=Rhodopirellula sallentina SM41 TaxID=1263870 RepID=M5TVI3_9BACT|nr:hypothetical protein [Rhodopirellula sallentina]EMI53197.1 hypothetical protein RSSM_05350 [Rhodopirellula sallentina SM41]
MSSKFNYKPGDWVIYTKQKSSTSPGPRAENVHAASKGNLYRYTVEKYWIIDSVGDNGTLVLRTRRGKRHEVSADDLNLRKARIWERWIHSSRFQLIGDASEPDGDDPPHDELDSVSSNGNDIDGPRA